MDQVCQVCVVLVVISTVRALDCQQYQLVHDGCQPVNLSSYCGTADLLYNGSTHGVVGRRFAFESTAIETRSIGADNNSTASCARICSSDDRCRGFVLVEKTDLKCITVNATLTVGTSLTCQSFAYQHNSTCRLDCGPHDGLSLPMTSRPRTVVSSLDGGQGQCEALCDRTPSCRGIVLDETSCYTVDGNTTGSVPVAIPIQSFLNQAPEQGGSPLHQSALQWWVAHSSWHVFAMDTPSMSLYCPTRQRVQWAGAPGQVQASQLALRASVALESPLVFRFAPLVHTTAADQISAAALSVREVEFVYAQENSRYDSELGSGYYPDILVPIENDAAACSMNGSCSTFAAAFKEGSPARFAFDSGGREISVDTVSSLEECQQACERHDDCVGITLVDGEKCHSVNDSAAFVTTVLNASSRRRQQVGLTILPNETRSVWLDLHIPTNATPGRYTGALEVWPAANDGASPVLTLPISVTVWPVAAECLAKSESEFGKAYGFNTTAVQEIYRYSPMPIQFDDFMCDHATPAESLASGWASARPIADVQKLLGARCGQPIFNAVFVGGFHGGNPAAVTEAFVEKLVAKIAPRMEQLEAAGLLGRAYVYGFDESSEGYKQAVVAVFGAIKKKWPAVRTMAVLNWLPSPELPVDIWVVQYQLLDTPPFVAAMQTMRAARKEVWGYHCVSPSGPEYLNTFLDVPLVKSRLLPWLATTQMASGWLYWYTNWGSSHAPSALDHALRKLTAVHQQVARDGRSTYDARVGSMGKGETTFTSEDGNLVYAGERGPLASMRLENWRMGAQDSALLRLFPTPEIAAHWARVLARSGTDFTIGAAVLEETRSAAAEALGTVLPSQCPSA